MIEIINALKSSTITDGAAHRIAQALEARHPIDWDDAQWVANYVSNVLKIPSDTVLIQMKQAGLIS